MSDYIKYPLYNKALNFEKNRDFKNAYQYYLESLHKEDYCESYYKIGKMYYEGQYVKRNYPKGCRYFEIAYEKGCRSMCSGDFLMMGAYRHIEVIDGVENGMTRDMILAIKWYKHMLEKCWQNCDSEGVLSAYSKLGRAYQEPEIGNYEKAYKYLKKSELRDSQSLLYMAKLYEYGLYVKQNPKKAMDYIYRIIRTPEFKNDCFYDCAMRIVEYGDFAAAMGNAF